MSNILKQAYGNPDTVTPELVQAILRPGFTANAPRVFLDFISYSAGPLPEEQLRILSSQEYSHSGKPRIPVSILWGEKDPWEPVSAGRIYAVRQLAPTSRCTFTAVRCVRQRCVRHHRARGGLSRSGGLHCRAHKSVSGRRSHAKAGGCQQCLDQSRAPSALGVGFV